MKKAIRYLRFSDKHQSNGSIERQELYTDQWIRNNGVELVDTFIDRGKSAKTFDRPDFKKLETFIRKHYRNVDYLLVDQMDRFSRDAGEAIKMVKKLQVEFNIQIVSVTEGITYDYTTPGSFFRTGLQLLLAEEDNINRSVKVRGGFYTAKAKEGRYVYKNPPFGYFKVGERKERHLEINQRDADVIRFIYDAYLNNVPIYKIAEKSQEMGFKRFGNVAVQRVLTYPVYAGMQYVEPYKDYPGGLFKALHEPIIDYVTWQNVQRKMKKPEKGKVIVEEELPLRGVLKCHCGKALTGAPSRGRHGGYYYYYKCNKTTHLNLSAKKAHEQLLQIFDLMSLPSLIIKAIKDDSEAAINLRIKNDKSLLADKQRELAQEDAKLLSIEEKWITNKINHETYQKWYTIINNNRMMLNTSINRLGQDQNRVYNTLYKTLDYLTDMKFVYTQADLTEKQEIVRLGFDNNLYYQNGVYRTPTMIDELAHNSLIMRDKGLLIYEKKRENFSIPPLSGMDGTRTRNHVPDKHAFYH
jgi:site-specific DNA recombinase